MLCVPLVDLVLLVPVEHPVGKSQGFWSHEELAQNDAPLSPREETYKRVPPMPPYRI